MADYDNLRLEVINGKYKIKKLLGKGVLGEVYLCESVIERKQYAIKSMNVKNDSSTMNQILGEAYIMQKFTHPNIVGAHETFFTPGQFKRFGITMDYYSLGDLNKYIRKQLETLPESLIFQIIYQLTNAVHYMHVTEGYVHRDIRPSHILVKTLDEENQSIGIALASFSSAEYLGNTEECEYIGGNTPAYMDYEKIVEQSDSKKADIWAIGVLWYQLLILPNQLDPDGTHLVDLFTENNQYHDKKNRKRYIQDQANVDNTRYQDSFIDILAEALHPLRNQRLSAQTLKQRLDDFRVDCYP